MSITREQWTLCRADYVTGKGSLATVARQHGLRTGSVEKCAKREGWRTLRSEFEAAQLAKLIPPPLPNLPPAPVAPDGAMSEAWLLARQEIHYRENVALIDTVRRLLDAKLRDGEKLSADELARLTTALGGIVTAESQLLGLRNRGREKRRRTADCLPEPYADPTPA